MASYSYTYGGDLTTTVATKLYQTVRNAREDAKSEKVVAEKEAAKYGVEPELKRGEFFGQALKYRMTPGFLREKKFGDQFNYPDYLARGQKSDDPLIGTPLASRVLPEYQQLANPLEQKYREKVKPKDPLVRPSTTYQDTVQRPVPTTDKKLGSLLVKIAETINKSISTIGERQAEVQTEISSAKDSSLAVARGLSVSTDTISDKLDDIANILNQQLALDKKIEDDKETDVVMQQVSDVDDLADTDAYAKLSDNPKLVAAQNEAEDIQRMRDNLMDTGEGPIDDDIPQAETGGIFSGPDSGYPVMLHGNEMVIPLDNNYTQGEPSAVDGQVRPKPQFETGVNNIVPTQPMVPKGKPMVSPTTKKNQTNDATTEDLIKVMEMPAKVAGLTTIAMMGRAASAMPMVPGMGGAIQSITQPIAETFGINNLVSNNLLKSVNTQQNSALNQLQNPPGLNMFDRVVNFFGGVGNFVSSIFNALNPFKDDEDDGGGGGYRAPGPPGGGGYNKMQPGGGLFDVFNTRPSGLARGTRGVRAGFTGMNSQGFNAMMQGQGYIPSNKPQILGKGAYSAPTFRGASRYAGGMGSLGNIQTPGGVVNSIVPGNAPRINFIEPQSKVSAGMFNKGRDLATKLQGGAYPNSVRANMLRSQITSGGVKAPVRGGIKPSHPFVMLAQMLIEELISPQPTAVYDQVTGPNAMYNNPKLSEEQRRIMYESVHGPQNNTGALLNVASSEAQTSRRQNQMTPVVLNNISSGDGRPQPESGVSAIASVGNAGTDTYTKGYTSPIFFD